MKTVFYPGGESIDNSARFAATIGFFDGVHRGHRFVIDQLKTLAGEKGQQTMVITFERHPRQVLHADWQPQLLTTLAERTELLAQTGIDMLVILHFDEAMACLSAQQFMQQVLHDDLHVGTLLTGYDNRFGHNRKETFADYQRYGQQMGMTVVAGQPLDIDGEAVSSSRIRRLLSDGQVDEARRCLGRPYTLSGRVVHGQQVGRRIGFPTANIEPESPERQVPAQGVYAVTIAIDHGSHIYQGMMNIGTRPTFDGNRQTLETNILDFTGNLYGHQLTVNFYERLRGEAHFDTVDTLVEQMNRDETQVRTILSSNHIENV